MCPPAAAAAALSSPFSLLSVVMNFNGVDEVHRMF